MPTPATVTLWRHDPVQNPQEPRYGLRSDYAERFYLPVVGPTAMAVLRHVDRVLPHAGDVQTVTIDQLKARFGVAESQKMHQVLVRLARFQVITSWEDESFGFPMDLPQVTRAQFDRLTDELKVEHSLMVLLGEQRDLSDAAFERFRELEEQEGR